MQPLFTFFFSATTAPTTPPPIAEELPDGLVLLKAEAFTEPMAVFTGDASVYHTDPSTEGRIKIRQTQPYPMTVLALFGEIEFGAFS